jgi:hypothetical protein
MGKFILRKDLITSATSLGIGSILSQIPSVDQNALLDANPDLVLDAEDGKYS